VLLTISKDEAQWARLTGEYKYAVDLQSKMVDAGRAKEREIAKNMPADGEPIERIMRYTNLTHEEAENLQ